LQKMADAEVELQQQQLLAAGKGMADAKETFAKELAAAVDSAKDEKRVSRCAPEGPILAVRSAGCLETMHVRSHMCSICLVCRERFTHQASCNLHYALHQSASRSGLLCGIRP